MLVQQPDIACRNIHRWLDDGGSDLTVRQSGGAETLPTVWAPWALKERLTVEHELRHLPRSGGLYAEASATLARIVQRVEQRQLTQQAAAAQLRHLTTRLASHRVRMVSRSA